MFPFWLSNDISIEHTFSLSDRGAAAIGAAFLPRTTLDKEINSELIAQLSELLEPTALNPFNKQSMRVWKGTEDAEFEADGKEDNHTALADTLVFALSRRKVEGAFDLLAQYFRSVGHSPTGGHYDPKSGRITQPGLRAHAVNIPLVLAALHRLNPQAAMELWIEKMEEANQMYRDAEASKDGYADDKIVWQFMYVDTALIPLAKQLFSKSEAKQAINQVGIVPHKSHSSFP